MQFVRIAPGQFQMGCSPGDKESRSHEKPAHNVRITKAFEIGKYEATQAQWKSVMGANPSKFKGDNRPVDSVS
jgi:formylglycine-generating enzyme required for sulfatase activity